MNSEYSNNPLTEVALALSMAFFSIMVLSIYALTHSSKNTEVNGISIQKSERIIKNNNNHQEKKVIFYFNNNFYTKDFKSWDNTNINLSKKQFLIAVPSNISVKRLFKIKDNLKNLDIKITQQNKAWNNALKNKFN